MVAREASPQLRMEQKMSEHKEHSTVPCAVCGAPLRVVRVKSVTRVDHGDGRAVEVVYETEECKHERSKRRGKNESKGPAGEHV